MPPPETDSLEDHAVRGETPMAAVAGFRPTDAHAKDCLRLALKYCKEPNVALCHRAQAAAIMRLMQSGWRALQRTQATREKAEAAIHLAAPVLGEGRGMEAAGWRFRDASVPLVDAAPASALAAASAAPLPAPAPAAPDFATMTEAEQYAAIYSDRAALIRAHGGLPQRVDFGPPDADLVAALVNGTSPILLALDRAPQRQPAITA